MVGKQYTGERNHLFPFLYNERVQGRVYFYDLHTDIFLFRVKGNFVYIFTSNHLPKKNLEIEWLQNESDILMDSVYHLFMCRWSINKQTFHSIKDSREF